MSALVNRKPIATTYSTYLLEPAAKARLAPEPDPCGGVVALDDGAVAGRRGAPRQDHVERARLLHRRRRRPAHGVRRRAPHRPQVGLAL